MTVDLKGIDGGPFLLRVSTFPSKAEVCAGTKMAADVLVEI